MGSCVHILLDGNNAPVAALSCQFLSTFVLSCQNNSTDQDSDLLISKWYVNGVLQESTEALSYEFTEEERGDVAIKLVVSDAEDESIKLETLHINMLPTVEFSCEQPDSFKLICNAELSLDPEGSDLTYTWLVGEGTFFDGQIIEIPITSYGIHKINLTVEDVENESSTKESLVNVYDYELNPLADFSYRVDMDWKVSLNGALAGSSNRKVELYKWTIDDGEEIEVISPVFEKNFTGAGTYQVKLVVVDSKGKESEIIKEIIVYHVSVPEPVADDVYNNYDGVDTDTDGVRDDIQRAILRVSEGNNDLATVLYDYSKSNSILLNLLSDSVLLNEEFLKQNRIRLCVNNKVGTKLGRFITKNIDVMNFDSLDRLKAWVDIKSLITEETFNQGYAQNEEEACNY
ncbi:hypothetical protein A9Q84_03290 [Halobacteriovorax marinus]|uniref:PKD domain-containing protein n=1 Tax=Halobacteriovorax marinus TaxID=97084 RepID=A0A1Y5F9U5_9BACT|nr:hypothetical protein A9Q84_03290 [Halobacteriovorax marinus]